MNISDLLPELLFEIIHQIHETPHIFREEPVIDDVSAILLGCVSRDFRNIVKKYYRENMPNYLRRGTMLVIGLHPPAILDWFIQFKWDISAFDVLLGIVMSNNTTLLDLLVPVRDENAVIGIANNERIIDSDTNIGIHELCEFVSSKEMLSMLYCRHWFDQDISVEYMMNCSIDIFRGTPYLAEEIIDEKYPLSHPQYEAVEKFIVDALLAGRYDIISAYSSRKEKYCRDIINKNRNYIFECLLLTSEESAPTDIFKFLHMMQSISEEEFALICDSINDTYVARQMSILVSIIEIFGRDRVFSKISANRIIKSLENILQYERFVFFTNDHGWWHREIEFLCNLYKEGVFFGDGIKYPIFLYYLLYYLLESFELTMDTKVIDVLCNLRDDHDAFLISYLNRCIGLSLSVKTENREREECHFFIGSTWLVSPSEVVFCILYSLAEKPTPHKRKPPSEILLKFLLHYSDLKAITSYKPLIPYIYRNYRDLPRGFWRPLFEANFRDTFGELVIRKTISDYLL
jgi:hypothetical protein